MPTVEKKCGRCGEIKPATEFHKRARSIDGLQAFCKNCLNVARRRRRSEKPEQEKATYQAWQESNKEKITSQRAAYRQANKDKLNEYNREWRKRNKDRVPGYYMKHTYGITREQYAVMLDQQGGVCAICKQECRVHARLSVDHCHRTNVVRGLLCQSCNTALGHLEDDPSRLLAAIAYLTKHAEENDE
ncbi:endonuclease VII domain-containing protein [Streptomyces sp. VNUA74]|uniref:endonuclease VII domain-containing protein n=1 Tax=Streptomyces sp. VNUA74 TaxID=3062685 RepID=UPI00280AC8BD|nr:endonuclease VII domain-containing protein [Streptomyces sp. VNUA74]WML79167.1 endonuclease VII domain-containing protein [Streptomyces sp. VNUA74]